MKRRKQVTLQDIADVLGVSKVTVSKAINNKEGVGDSLKKQILAKAEEMGYKFSKNSSGDDNGVQNGNIVVYMDAKFFEDNGVKGYFYMKMYHLIAKQLGRKGCATVLSTIEHEINVGDALNALGGSDVVGAIVIGKLEESFLAGIRNIELPLLFVDFYDELSDSECVMSENIYSTYAITKHLLEKGHYMIGYAGSIHVTHSILDRYLGFERALLERRIQVDHRWVLEDRDIHNEPVEFQLPDELPTAFVCNCDETAMRLIKKLKAEGHRVPEDISIVSFDNDIFAEFSEPKLTTVAVDVEKIAKVAADRIHKQVQRNKRKYNNVTRVNGKIIYRDSVYRDSV